MKIFLIGFMGSGKSTVGPIVAKMLGIPFLDADSYLEKQVGMSIAKIFELEGEAYFRNLEKICLEEIVSLDDCVVATGGGLIENEANCLLMKQSGTIVYLEALAKNVLKMTAGKADRPLLNIPDPLAFITEKLRHRDPIYKKWADLIVAAHTTLPEEIAGRIIDYLKK